MIDNPHFAFPFRLVGTRVVTVEQGSDDEILDCVEVLLSTEPGERVDIPDYGLEDQTFRQGGASWAEIRSTVRAWEPRALTEVEESTMEGRVNNMRVKIRRSRG
jgi:phage baseplate assembly protein W